MCPASSSIDLIVDPDQGMTYNIGYDPALSGETRKPESEFAPFPFSVRKTIARRAAMELRPGAVINVGFGVPDGVMKVAREQGFAQSVVPTIEQGQIGGIPAEGLEFGAAYNSTAIIGTLRQFAWYQGRGVDIAFLGFAEVDAAGNVNVSKLDSAIIGTGGFIDIAQKARKVVFCGTLAVRGGKPKFVPAVRQITFSGAQADLHRPGGALCHRGCGVPSDCARAATGGSGAGARPGARRDRQDGLPAAGRAFPRQDARRVVRAAALARRLFPGIRVTVPARSRAVPVRAWPCSTPR